jgi:hypothetical protein
VEHATDDAELISDTLLTRLGEVLLGRERLGKQEKVDLLIRFATEKGRAPKKDDRMDGVNIGIFLINISGNWRGKKVRTTLTRQQMDAIEACLILSKRVAKRHLPRKERIACVLKLEKKPSREATISVDYNGAAYPFSIGMFVHTALHLAAQGEGEKKLLQLPWFAAALAKLKHRHAGGEPSYTQKLNWLVEHGKAPDWTDKWKSPSMRGPTPSPSENFGIVCWSAI